MSNIPQPSSTDSSHPDIEECHYLQGLFWGKMYLTEQTYRNLVALIFVNSLAVIPTILLNALVIFVVATRRPLQTTSNILLACLAGTDLLAELVVEPLVIAVNFQRLFGVEPFCALETACVIAIFVPCYASMNHLVLISIDRYVAIKDALRYHVIVTKQRIKKGILMAWAITVCLIIHDIALAVLDSETKINSVYWVLASVLVFFVGLVCISIICYCYAYIFSETRRQKRRLQTEQLSQEEAKRVKKDRKAANTLTIILFFLMITYLPSIIFFLVLATVSREKLNPGDVNIFASWALTSVLLGSLVNPVIYCWRNKKLRRAFLEICHVRQPGNRAPDIEMTEIQRRRPEIQPFAREAFSMAVVSQEPVLLSFSHLQAEEIVHIQEINN